jgi:DNA-directed RNA polymerase III subunit RPC1
LPPLPLRLLHLCCWLCCRVQAVLGGNKGGLFGSLAADFSPAVAAAAMSRLAKMSARVMGDVGFSIGIDDVMPREQLLAEKAATLDKGYSSVQDYIGAQSAGDL